MSSSSLWSPANAFLLLICCCTIINSTIGQGQNQPNQEPPNEIINLNEYACATSKRDLDLSQMMNKTGNAQMDEIYDHPTFKPLPGMDATFALLTPCDYKQTFEVIVESYNPDELPPEAAMVWPENSISNLDEVPSCKSLFKKTVQLSDICELLEDERERVSCKPWTDPDYQQSKYSLDCESKFHVQCKLSTVQIPNYTNIYLTYFNIRGFESTFPCQYIYKTTPGYRLLISKDVPNSMSIKKCLSQLKAWNKPCVDPKESTIATTSKPITSTTKPAPTTRRNTTTPAATTTTPAAITTTTVKVKTTSITNAATTITSGPTPVTTITPKTNSTITKTNGGGPKPEEHPCLLRWPFLVLIVITSLLLILLIVLICLCLFRRCKKEEKSKGEEALAQEHPSVGQNEANGGHELTNNKMTGSGTGCTAYYVEGEDDGIDVPESMHLEANGDRGNTNTEEYNELENLEGKGGNDAAIYRTGDEDYNEIENLHLHKLAPSRNPPKPPSSRKPPPSRNPPKPKIKKEEPIIDDDDGLYANIDAITSDLKDDDLPEELYSHAEPEEE